MKNQKFLNLKDNVKIFRGYVPNSLKELKDIEQSEKMKILGFGNIRKMLKDKNTDFVEYNYFNLSRKLKKDYCYIRQYDIVMPLLFTGNELPTLLIEDEPKEKLLYNTTVVVIRTDNILISTYLYLMLKTKPIQNKILELASKDDNRMHRITVEMLQNLKIKFVDDIHKTMIVKEYYEIENEKKAMLDKENNFWKNISN